MGFLDHLAWSAGTLQAFRDCGGHTARMFISQTLAPGTGLGRDGQLFAIDQGKSRPRGEPPGLAQQWVTKGAVSLRGGLGLGDDGSRLLGTQES